MRDAPVAEGIPGHYPEKPPEYRKMSGLCNPRGVIKANNFRAAATVG